jgi:hypothetical protein
MASGLALQSGADRRCSNHLSQHQSRILVITSPVHFVRVTILAVLDPVKSTILLFTNPKYDSSDAYSAFIRLLYGVYMEYIRSSN